MKKLPRDNRAHRERFGLDGAYDESCDDICCAPSGFADPKPTGEDRGRIPTATCWLGAAIKKT